MIKKYKVGGYVRDKILGIQSQDIDYVVVGATPSYMQKLGFVPVGRHFPVFIDPKTQTQYALARTERKTGVGYHGFEFYTAPDVTLEQDLKRRDITINAIAEDEHGQLIDPFNGIADLKHKILRHTSPAFAEDPLRVLRVARFRAKFDFNIANETLKLMQQIVIKNELEHLSTERIWDELRKSLAINNTMDFFATLNQVGALEHIFHDFKITLDDKNLYQKIKANLNQAVEKEYTSEEKFAIIISNISTNYPDIAKNIVKTCKLGHHYSDLGYIINKNLASITKLEVLNPTAILQLIKNLDPIRREDRFRQVCRVLTITNSESQHLEFLKTVAKQFSKIDYTQFADMKQQDLISAINTTKLNIVSNLQKEFL
ncbi:MAG TPA: multifunctional CCA tRNA nucleotidyl transferase/2'3'-cyclic phosphodiesterase/2'nucleotidase/phosphatase [Aquella sp.]|nr:multifunctional CCA tRNA nucleotidyl transferase/2'3'-cyclic phosphodiesterase/2'nucleotidase/phosphatase [Aquella sp.]